MIERDALQKRRAPRESSSSPSEHSRKGPALALHGETGRMSPANRSREAAQGRLGNVILHPAYALRLEVMRRVVQRNRAQLAAGQRGIGATPITRREDGLCKVRARQNRAWAGLDALGRTAPAQRPSLGILYTWVGAPMSASTTSAAWPLHMSSTTFHFVYVKLLPLDTTMSGPSGCSVVQLHVPLAS